MGAPASVNVHRTGERAVSHSAVLEETPPTTGSAAPRAAVSGRYRGHSHDEAFVAELRVDVAAPDEPASLSADIAKVTDGGAQDYQGSLRIDDPVVELADGRVTISGEAEFTWSTALRHVTVQISIDATGGRHSARLERSDGDRLRGPIVRYDLAWDSPHLRTVELVEDREASIEPFDSFDAGERELTIASAFATAGIELSSRPATGVVAAPPGIAWSDAELHHAMQQRIGRSDDPAWRIWLLHAGDHVRNDDPRFPGERVAGVMFDRNGLAQRQGCAIFYAALRPGGSSADRRLELHTCVHELGHVFNLHHCFRHSLVGAARPDALTWMNYPHEFPHGEDAYWRQFEFEFDARELAHLRHGFRNRVIMGANPFSYATQYAVDDFAQAQSTADGGLRLELRASRRLELGVPATLELSLSARSAVPQAVPSVLGPRPGTIDVFVRRPGGEELVFKPFVNHCRDDATVMLAAGEPPITDTTLLHYGRDGHVFTDAGAYELRARYEAPDGSALFSDVVTVRVPPAATIDERDLRRTVLGDEEGQIMSFMGTPALTAGQRRLETMITRFGAHPAATAARLALGCDAARAFHVVSPDGSVDTRPSDPDAADRLLGDVFDVRRLRRQRRPAPPGAAVAAGRGPLGGRPREPSGQAALRELRRSGSRLPASVERFALSRPHEIVASLSDLQLS